MPFIKKLFTRDYYKVSYQVTVDEEGMRLDQFMKIYLKTLSRQFVQKKIKKKEIYIEKREAICKPNTKLCQGDYVTMIAPNSEDFGQEIWRGELLEIKKDIDIVYEDETMVAVLKPPFISTHPTGGHLFDCATVIMEEKLGHKVYSVHRLDRETSGVLVLAKTSAMASHMVHLFENKKVNKAYFLIGEKQKILQSFPFQANERLGQDEDSAKRHIVHPYPENSKFGKVSATLFDEIFQDDRYIIALAYPKTGRQHQIRVHAKAHGFRLLGDKVYNQDPLLFGRFKDGNATESDHDEMQLPRHALHAMGINFNDKNIISQLPEDLKKWIVDHLGPRQANTIFLKAKTKIDTYFNSFK